MFHLRSNKNYDPASLIVILYSRLFCIAFTMCVCNIFSMPYISPDLYWWKNHLEF